MPGLLLLFEQGSRPDRNAIAAALADNARVAIVTRDASGQKAVPDPWRDVPEILVDGLTFDLHGVLPASSMAPFEVVHRFDCDPAELAGCEAVCLYPGLHIAEGAHALPIVRSMLGVGAQLAEQLDGVRAVCWTPARSAISPHLFIGAVSAWLSGGRFPSPGLFGLHEDSDGFIRSDGVAFFIGSELEIDSELGIDCGDLMRLASCAAHELVGYGVPQSVKELPFDDGTIRLAHDCAAGAVRVGYAKARVGLPVS